MRILQEKLKLMIWWCSSDDAVVVVAVSLPLRLNINVNFLYPSKVGQGVRWNRGAGKFCILNETWAVWSLCNQTPPKSRDVGSRGDRWREGREWTTKIPRSAQHSSRRRSRRRGLVSKHSDRHREREKEGGRLAASPRSTACGASVGAAAVVAVVGDATRCCHNRWLQPQPQSRRSGSSRSSKRICRNASDCGLCEF